MWSNVLQVSTILITMIVEVIRHIYRNVSIPITVNYSICLGHDTSSSFDYVM